MLTTALTALGGSFGMLGGIAALGILGLISKGLSDYGFEATFKATVDELGRKGKSKVDIEREVESYPTSRDLKLKIKDYLRTMAYSNPIWIVRRIPQESFSQQPFSLHNSFRIAIVMGLGLLGTNYQTWWVGLCSDAPNP